MSHCGSSEQCIVLTCTQHKYTILYTAYIIIQYYSTQHIQYYTQQCTASINRTSKAKTEESKFTIVHVCLSCQSVLAVVHILLRHWYFLFPPIAGDVWFSLKGITYQNNSIVTLEDIGEGGDALLCMTDVTDCCQPHLGRALGNWFFPNGTRVPSSGNQWDFHRSRGESVVRLQRRRGGVDGIYRCVIPVPQSDAEDVNQTIFIGVYAASTGESSLVC